MGSVELSFCIADRVSVGECRSRDRCPGCQVRRRRARDGAAVPLRAVRRALPARRVRAAAARAGARAAGAVRAARAQLRAVSGERAGQYAIQYPIHYPPRMLIRRTILECSSYEKGRSSTSRLSARGPRYSKLLLMLDLRETL